MLSEDFRLLCDESGRSASGGGVGGNMLRCIGGSDCCLDLLVRFGLTRFNAPYESLSSGRSSIETAARAAFRLASTFH